MTADPTGFRRRSVFQAAGLAALGATLAACDDERQGPKSDTFIYAYPYSYEDASYNTFLGKDAFLDQAAVTELLRPSLAMLNWETYQWTGLVIEDHAWDGDTLHLALRSGVNWSSGDRLSAKDVLGTFQVERINADANTPGWSDVKKVEALSETEVAVTFHQTYYGVETEILRSRVSPYAVYHEWMDRAAALLEDGVEHGDDEQVAFDEELTALAPPQEDFLAYGPYKLDAASEEDVDLVLNDGGLFSDRVGFARCRAVNADNSEATRLLLQQEIDYMTQVLDSAKRDILYEVEGITETNTPGNDGVGLMFNYGDDPAFDDVRLRKALLHVLDREYIGEDALGGGGFSLPHYDCGLPDRHAEEIYSTEELAEMPRYDTDQGKARELLEEIGWSLSPDGWKDDSGEPVSYTVVAPAGWSDFEAVGKQVADQLSTFGIRCEYEAIDGGNPWGVWNAGDFQIAVRHWGNPTVPYHYGSWAMTWFTDNERTDASPGMDYDTTEVETDTMGTVEIDGLYEKARKGSEEERVEANKELGRIFHETLPRLPLVLMNRVTYGIEDLRANTLDTGEYAANDIYTDNPVMLRMLQGDIGPA
ncbi:ABC transporter substrate-binding protein [Salininema proteolyticum]|uniref:ABC transporter substrate-binding protein n=1 Tax=Salininema proteolyticum TaxID=1607685 RepID=A0ABV8TY04_9ACTN